MAKPTFKILLVSWTKVVREIRSFNAENLKSVGKRAAKLLAIKLWEWFELGPFGHAHSSAVKAEVADFFSRLPTLTASNFAALRLTDPKFSAFEILNPFKTVKKVQGASRILKVAFALSKWPHFTSIYLVRLPFLTGIAVIDFSICTYIL